MVGRGHQPPARRCPPRHGPGRARPLPARHAARRTSSPPWCGSVVGLVLRGAGPVRATAAGGHHRSATSRAGTLGGGAAHVWDQLPTGGRRARRRQPGLPRRLPRGAPGRPSPRPPSIDWSALHHQRDADRDPVGAVGGPGHWHLAWAAQLEATPVRAHPAGRYVVVATVVASRRLTRDRAMRAWLIPVGAAGPSCVLLVAKTRLLFGPGIALDLRFFAPLALGIALALGLAFLPVRDAVESVRAAQPALAGRPATARGRRAGGLRAVRVLERVRRTRLLNLGAPEQRPTAFDDSRSRAVRARRPGAAAGRRCRARHRPAGGPLQPALLAQLRRPAAVPGRRPGRLLRRRRRRAAGAPRPRRGPPRAGARARAVRLPGPLGASTMPLDGPVFGFGWRVRVTYTADADTAATISLGDVHTDVHAAGRRARARAAGRRGVRGGAVQRRRPGRRTCASPSVDGGDDPVPP